MPEVFESLSVIIPNYNHAKFLPLALDGILSQSVLPGEIIIIDDQSTDDSWDCILEYQQRHPELIKAYKNPENLGALANTEKGLHMSGGEWIYIHSADDFISADCIKTYRDLVVKHPKAGMAASRVATFLEHPSDFKWEYWRWEPEEGFYHPDSTPPKIRTRSFSSGQIMYRKSAIFEAGGVDHELYGYADWFWTFVTLFRHGMVYTPKTLCYFRLTGDDSLGASSVLDEGRYRSICKKLIEKVTSSEFEDILPKFAESGVINHLGEGIVRTVLSEPKFWSSQVFALTQSNFHSWNIHNDFLKSGSQLKSNDFHSVMKEKLDSILSMCRSWDWNQLVIYGAGTHTQELLELIDEKSDRLCIRKIVTSEEPETDEIEGIEAISIDRLDAKNVQFALMSSHRFEIEMARTWKKRFPEVPFFLMYSDLSLV
ncbi:MAG: glycosyltransferase family 2 protein [Opitutales bacterium]|nr:glycosyltransferase family 2 protein [Opitutales bacterium]